MKLKHIIIGLVSVLGIGMATGAVFSHENRYEFKETNAADTGDYATEKESIFLVGANNSVSSYWLSQAKPCVWYWDSTGTKGVTSQCIEITKITNYLGYFTLPYGVDHFKLLRAPDTAILPSDSYPDGAYTSTNDIAVHWNDWLLTNFIAITSDLNGVSSYNYSGSYTVIPSGTFVTLETSKFAGVDWEAADASTYLYMNGVNKGIEFYGYTSSRWWKKLDRIGSTKYYGTVFSETIVTDVAIFCRANPTGQASAGADQSEWWLYDPDEDSNNYHLVWNKTTDIKSGWGWNPSYLTVGKNDGLNWAQASYEETATAYSTYFINTMTCDGNGNVSSKDNWTTCSNAFNGIIPGAQNCMKIATQSDTQSSQTTKEAVARYDYIIYKYTVSEYPDFIGRTKVGGGYAYGANVRTSLINIAVNNNGAAPIIISVIAVISLTAIGGYYFLSKNKKKENQ